MDLTGMNLTDSELADALRYPGTRDSERYARRVRALIQQELRRLYAVLHTPHELAVMAVAYEGALRRITQRSEIAETRSYAAESLDVIEALVPAFRWRDDSKVVVPSGIELS